MVDLSKLEVAVKGAIKRTHTNTAMILPAQLENMLSIILQSHMPKLSNRLKERLFEGYGPLGSFSAKIDLAFVFGHISEDDRRMLHAIRDIRNAFAHSLDFNLHFDHETLIDLLAKLPRTKKPETSNSAHFIGACGECVKQLKKHLDSIHLVQALKENVDQSKASHDK